MTCARVMPGSIRTVETCARAGEARTSVNNRRSGRMSPPGLGGDTREQGFEYAAPVSRSEKWIDGAFRVRHHAKDVSTPVHDTCDSTHGSVRIRSRIDLTGGIHVAKHDATLLLEAIERRVVRREPPFAVSDRDPEDRSVLVLLREHRCRRLHAQANPVALEAEAVVPQQRAGEQPRLAGDLETVANGEHGPA